VDRRQWHIPWPVIAVTCGLMPLFSGWGHRHHIPWYVPIDLLAVFGVGAIAYLVVWRFRPSLIARPPSGRQFLLMMAVVLGLAITSGAANFWFDREARALAWSPCKPVR
jgi:hypothetical protein